jgi:hypothetical protein
MRTLREYIDLINEMSLGHPLGEPRLPPNTKRNAARAIEADAHDSLTEENEEDEE